MNLYFIDTITKYDDNIFLFTQIFNIQCLVVTRMVTVVKLYETLFQKISTAKRSVFFLFFLSLFKQLVAECLEMLTWMNMFNAPSFYSVLLTRSVIKFNGNMGSETKSKERDARGACVWTNKRNKRTKWKMSEQTSEWSKRTRWCAQAYFTLAPNSNAIWQLDRTVGIDKYLLLQLIYLKFGW